MEVRNVRWVGVPARNHEAMLVLLSGSTSARPTATSATWLVAGSEVA